MVAGNISLVPVFRESEVEGYFGAFERIAAALHWPKDVWATLLQCRLTGRAQEACVSLFFLLLFIYLIRTVHINQYVSQSININMPELA
jgi:hypothetical protein